MVEGWRIGYLNLFFKSSNILLETDSPYLTPEPNRGKINSPLNLKYIAKFLSDLYNIPYDDVIKITSKNAKKVFNIR